MKIVSALLGVCVLLLAALLFYQYRVGSVQHLEMTALANEREDMKREVKRLHGLITELQAQAAAAAAAAKQSTQATQTAAAAGSAAPVVPVERPGVTVKAPVGWMRNGKKAEMYTVGVDSNETWGGMPSAYVESHTPTVDGFGGMMQTTAADSYAGKRVRLSGWVKTQEANEGGGHLWLRIDGQERGQMLGFDNMDNRAVKGTADWQEASIVLDVPAGARALAYGFFVSGGGKMWVNGQRIEEVGRDVPTTNMIALPAKPQNLGFDPNRAK